VHTEHYVCRTCFARQPRPPSLPSGSIAGWAVLKRPSSLGSLTPSFTINTSSSGVGKKTYHLRDIFERSVDFEAFPPTTGLSG
jgi:hypothetical protein